VRQHNLDNAKEVISHCADTKSEVASSSDSFGAHRVFNNFCFLKTQEQFFYLVNIIRNINLEDLL